MIDVPAGIQAVADHGALHALLGQRRLDELLRAQLGEHTLDGDPSAGQLWFVSRADPRRRIGSVMQVVASIAPGPRSLLWGWAHPQAADRSAAEQLRTIGEQHGLPDLTTAEVPFRTDASGERLGTELAQLGHAVAAAGVEATGRTPYYLAPIGGGSLLVVLLPDIALRPVDLAVDGAGLTSALLECPTTAPRSALLGLARHAGWRVRSEPDGSADEVTDGRSTVQARWDPSGRLAGLHMSLHGAGRD